MLAFLDFKVIKKVAHLADAHAVYKESKKMFAATEESLKMN